MPFTFPSHPGLILPLWVVRPRRFDAWALTVGSVLPDIVDRAVGILIVGNPVFKMVHSLAGAVTIGLPVGFALVAATAPAADWLLAPRRIRRLPAYVRSWLIKLRAPWRPGLVLLSVAVGLLSHLVFDAVSHDPFDWLRPWVHLDLLDLLPPSFSGPWVRVRLPFVDRPWGIWMFDLVWLSLTLLGAILFVWCWRVGRERASWR